MLKGAGCFHRSPEVVGPRGAADGARGTPEDEDVFVVGADVYAVVAVPPTALPLTLVETFLSARVVEGAPPVVVVTGPVNEEALRPSLSNRSTKPKADSFQSKPRASTSSPVPTMPVCMRGGKAAAACVGVAVVPEAVVVCQGKPAFQAGGNPSVVGGIVEVCGCCCVCGCAGS